MIFWKTKKWFKNGTEWNCFVSFTSWLVKLYWFKFLTEIATPLDYHFMGHYHPHAGLQSTEQHVPRFHTVKSLQCVQLNTIISAFSAIQLATMILLASSCWTPPTHTGDAFVFISRPWETMTLVSRLASHFAFQASTKRNTCASSSCLIGFSSPHGFR